MGFKVDASFLRFLTMGAVSARAVADEMHRKGLRPIELERQSTSNKIWATKIKRVRLPDLLCVRTGVRVEVRAKSKLAIRMSDAPKNPDRKWSAGLCAADLVVFVKCFTNDAGVAIVQSIQAFNAGAMAACDMSLTTLGPPKSVSEGSERDRIWPTIVSSKAGKVVTVEKNKVIAQLSSGRLQSYSLRGILTPYVKVGETFDAELTFIAGLPRKRAAMPTPGIQWDPRPLLTALSSVDRYVGVKALGHLGKAADSKLLADLVRSENDSRVSLEAAIALARIGDDLGLAMIATEIKAPSEPYLAMEAVLALAELMKSPLRDAAADLLVEVATDINLVGSEIRQAAIWGLGVTGLQAYDKLLPLLNASDKNERIHALVAMGDDFGECITLDLAKTLLNSNGNHELAATVSEVLSHSRHPTQVIDAVLPIALTANAEVRAWALVVLGAIPSSRIDLVALEAGLTRELRPLQLLSQSSKDRKRVLAVDFIRQQAI